MKKRFLSILFAMLLVVLPFTLIGCNTPDDSTNNSGTEGQLLTLQDYHNEIKSIADFCGLIIDEPNTSMTLNDNARDSFSPNLKFIGPIENYGDLEIVFYNNLAKVTLENKLFTTQEGNKPVDYSYCEFGNTFDTLYSYTTEKEWVIEETTKENNVSYKMSLQVIYNLIDPQYYELQSSFDSTANYILNEDKREDFSSTLSFIFGEGAQIGSITLSINNQNELRVFIENNNETLEFLIERGSQYLEIPSEAINN